jgi:hypothetical protein
METQGILSKRLTIWLTNFTPIIEGKPYQLSYEELYALNHAHDLAIEKAGVEEYHTLTGHDFSEALALQEKLHAYLAAMKQAEE